MGLHCYGWPYSCSAPSYILSDHLGSTAITVNASGAKIAEMRYKAWGEVRFSSGVTPTDKGYTGQRSYVNEFGLQFYNARWYDSSLGRFSQADTIVPGGVQGLDRYAYTGNNPVNFNDPSGHKRSCHDEYQAGRTIQMCSGSDNDDDPVELTGNGDALKGVLDRLNGKKGWWNNWDLSNQLSVTDLMLIILSAELKGVSNDDATAAYFSHAGTHWFWDSCRNYANCSGPTDNALLNWMGGNLESAMRLFGGADPTEYDKSLAYSVAGSILGSHGADPEWQLPITNENGNADHPIHWGNASYYRDNYGGYIPLPTYQQLGGKNPFYLIPYLEEHRMCIAAFGSIKPSCPPKQ